MTRAATPLWHRLSTWLTVYAVALALIGFWPDSRIEFGSNILLFVPLGVGVALLLPRMRYLVLPVALLASLTIESAQAVFIAARTPSIHDILANVSGAALGLVGVALVEAWRVVRRRRRTSVSHGA